MTLTNMTLEDISALSDAHTSGVYTKRPLALVRAQRR